ncbi:serine/threonine protein kinase [Modestobacter lapidis]|nr:serine/threonine protein kinase [Modestobacter lapidis]
MVEPARSTLGNRYELAGLLATGGMGQVWRAYDQLLGRPVAVKVLRSEYTGDPLFRARFRAEAHHAAALSHPNIAAVYDYGEEVALDGSDERLAYLVMELVEGESLSAELSRTGALSPARTLEVLRQTAGALGAAHAAGVVHRDVKPGNVLVRADGTVKITDFGIAWSAGSVPLTQTGQVIGTAAYLSPEQAAGSHATAASDVYSLGMVGYECLTGRKAFDGDNSLAIAIRQLRDQPEPLPPEVPAGVRSLIDHALVKDPAHRIADGDAFVAAVDDVLAGAVLPPVAHPDTLSFWLVPGGVAGSGAGTGTAPGTSPGTGAAAGAAAPARGSARRRLGRMLVPVAALLLGAGIAGTVVQQSAPPAGGGGTAEAAAVADRPAAPSGAPVVAFAAGHHVGRPVEQVRAELEGLGLLVQTEAVTTDEHAADLVLEVTPGSGELRRGDLVLLRYAVLPQRVAPSRPAPAETVVQPPVGTPDPPGTTEPTPATTVPATGAPSDTGATTGVPGTSTPGTSTPGTSTPGTSTPGTTTGTGPATGDGTDPDSGVPEETGPTGGNTGGAGTGTGPDAGSTDGSTPGGTGNPGTGDAGSGGAARVGQGGTVR